MSPELERLIRLQQLDSTIEDARRRIAAHPQRLAQADARLNDTTQRVEIARQRLKDNQEAPRALEKDVALYQGRISKSKDQQAAVKTNKEYEALGHEMETANHDLGAVEEKVIKMRFGVGDGSEHTLEEVGQNFAVTRERIRQIEAKALRKLRDPSRSEQLRSFLIENWPAGSDGPDLPSTRVSTAAGARPFFKSPRDAVPPSACCGT